MHQCARRAPRGVAQHEPPWRQGLHPRGEHLALETEAETLEAGNIGPRMLAATAARELSRDAVSERAELRNRTRSVHDNAYAKCRRAVEYLLDGKGDIDQLVPSFRQQAGGRRRSEGGSEEPVVGARDGAASGAPVAGGAVPAAPVAGAGHPIGDGGDPFKR